MTPTETIIREEICRRLALGESLRSICRDAGFPAHTRVYVWAAQEPDFGEQYARARQTGYQKLADEILEIADTPVSGERKTTKVEQTIVHGHPVEGSQAVKTEVTETDMIEHRRLQVDTRKWLLSKVLPKLYGDKVAVEASGPNGGPIRHAVAAVTQVLDLSPVEASQAYKAIMEGGDDAGKSS